MRTYFRDTFTIGLLFMAAAAIIGILDIAGALNTAKFSVSIVMLTLIAFAFCFGV